MAEEMAKQAAILKEKRKVREAKGKGKFRGAGAAGADDG